MSIDAERPRVGDKVLYTLLLEAYIGMVNWRLGGTLRKKRGIIGWKGRGE
jgi:hypothetical protein